ncbi:MAG: molybdopterin molybdotransferase MoeA [Planctomycetes bacterium]|nr:molybdopterin molybdotransferase MoeA [Planctomycetota bacterium]
MIDVDRALAIVHETVTPPPIGAAVATPLREAVGRVLAEDVRADTDLPPFARSTMDGFAVRSSDTQPGGARLRVVGESAAGRPFDGVVEPGRAVAIFTGAVLPAGADAVIQVERTTRDGDVVVCDGAVRVGQNVSRQGEDARAGDVLVARGSRLTTGHVGLLATVGAIAPLCLPAPRVAILATGTELVDAASTPRVGQVRESNGAALSALVERTGARVVSCRRLPDDRDVIRAGAAEALATADVVLLSGGSSVGDYDFTPEVLADLGVVTHFDRIALKPGKPTIFGTRDDANGDRRVVFGVPGNPISAFTVFHLFVKPALALRFGCAPAVRARLPARLDAAVKRVAEREQALPAVLTLREDGLHARHSGWHGSGDVTCVARANGFVFIPAGTGELGAGERVFALPLDAGGPDVFEFLFHA